MPTGTSVITSAPIAAIVGRREVYSAYDRVARGRSVAPLAAGAERCVETHRFPFSIRRVRRILTARRGQTMATARLLVRTGRTPAATTTPLPLLDGVRFSMPQLISRTRFLTLPYVAAMAEARRAFVEKLFDDELLERRGHIERRLADVVAVVRSCPEPTLVIGHNFFVRLLYLWVASPRCFADRAAFVRAFRPDRKPYEPLEGFVLPPRRR